MNISLERIVIFIINISGTFEFPKLEAKLIIKNEVNSNKKQKINILAPTDAK